MANFEVKIDSLANAADQLEHINHEVRKVSNEAKRILSDTRSSITARLAIHLQRAVVCSNINNCAADYKNLAHTLDVAARHYRLCEARVESKELFDQVNDLWNAVSLIGWFKIPIIKPIFPKPIIKPYIISDIVLPWSPIIMPKPWKPWKPTPFIGSGIWHTPLGPMTPVGPGGQNPKYRTDDLLDKIKASLLTGYKFSTVGSAVRLV